MWTVLEYWWPLIVLILVWVGLNTVMFVLFKILKSGLDHLYPDVLPLTTAQFLHQVLESWGMSDKITILPADKNAFLPEIDVIFLDETTYYKSDPFFWAIGAHELGHMLVRARAPLPGLLLDFGRQAMSPVALFGQALILANVLFGNPVINQYALNVIIAGLVLGSLILLDELLASLAAVVILRKWGEFGIKEIAVATAGLAAAFLTYASVFAAQLVVYIWFDSLAERIESGVDYAPGEALGIFWTIVAFVATIALILRGLSILGELTEKGQRAAAQKAGEVGTLLVLLWLTWDQGEGLAFELTFCLAALPAWKGLFALVVLLLLPLFWLVTRFPSLAIGLEKLVDWMRDISAPEESPELLNAKEQGPLMLPERYEALDQKLEARKKSPARRPLRTTAFVLYELAYFPYLVVYWFFA